MKEDRLELVKAMELIARSVNDEEVFEDWLVYGVADGEDDLSWYTDDDETFAELMRTFLDLMKEARKSGGLYCDKVVSK